ncbi:hypothetical protein E5676_scaffold21G003100 [Cucumis melo var. makuwa]|uniref:Uncharacterized protein n=2 Tax=Cucumis melo TaxID=3656 RepID=A0A5A7TS47_CUCMM|nr:hypothetical protein E6C27_scaffold74G002720 [Cucumis melo var. makuwa]TYK16502.1 hypothetical protein E5676_scaffold21G003100 [Cucumis melo var. makuwa]
MTTGEAEFGGLVVERESMWNIRQRGDWSESDDEEEGSCGARAKRDVFKRVTDY